VMVLVVGGTRSGKSEVAEQIARKLDEPVTFVGIGKSTDPEITTRIEAHRARRPPAWRTVECEDDHLDLVETVTKLEGTVLIDSLGTWVARAPEMTVDAAGFVDAVRERSGSTVVVSEEVGLSVHAPTESGRHFADSLGLLNAAVAAAADRVLLVVAGRAVPLAAVDDVLGAEDP
jgi:adenosyl cobinamide kinase/adenosyl cobinamide phosphate guanylyltransferase